MTCDRCGVKFSYSFVVNNNHWFRANDGVKEGHLCAHCVLSALAGVDWYIVDCEPLRNAREGTSGPE